MAGLLEERRDIFNANLLSFPVIEKYFHENYIILYRTKMQKYIIIGIIGVAVILIALLLVL